MRGPSPDYFVRPIALPPTIDGVTVPNDDGTFDIYLNSTQPEKVQQHWLRHELAHILSDHFYKAMDVAEMEREAEGEVPAEGDDLKVFSNLSAMLDYYTDYPWRIIEDYG